MGHCAAEDGQRGWLLGVQLMCRPTSATTACSLALWIASALSFAWIVLFPHAAWAAVSPADRAGELAYLRMSLVMNSSYHLVQYPLYKQGQLKLTPSRAFVSLSGGLLYAGTAGLAFTTEPHLRTIGYVAFMVVSAIGATFVVTSLIRCISKKEQGCWVKYFNALNVLILMNQILAWTLSIRQM